ncbi:LysR family transcriptional regulator [Saccharothrix coeruleofusca]|uniref:LysR family transcriptional regulator n=1 Tax=Saccharothrix coeruleofusca TaxID=33919 RepID=A0A918AJI0_9PSEU|nr:LysR family transcriptional regulator [Saccharothrix coeruleofusca]GGP50170.1 LysR family transcriptional regulator [Saccharothrix coeruleofusca]
MDVIAACKAFVAVSGHGSFTVGAAAARIPQSVASRRVAALEKHLGVELLTRSSRSVALTPFGREVLPSARRLVELAEALEHDAAQARLRPFRLAVPEVCGPRPLAALVAGARAHDLNLDPRPAAPRRRAELARTLEVRAAVVAVPPDDGAWRVPLGLAGHTDPGDAPAIYLESLRAGRAERTARRRRVLIQAEDDVPHVRDRVRRLGHAVGLQPAQVVVAGSLVAAVAEVLASDDLLLCARGQAEELGLHWRPVGELDAARGYDVTARSREDGRRVRALPPALIGRCLGVPEGEPGWA